MKLQQADLQIEAAALTSLNSGISALQTQVNALRDPLGVFAQNVATSSQTGILSATAQSSAAAASHIVVVNNLASTGTAYSNPVSDANATFEPGVISLQVGAAQHDIQVDSTNSTLTGLVKTINQQAIGVTASIINDASGSRLALVSNTMGSAGDLKISANTSGLAMNKGATGKNASLTIDGLPFSSANNTVTGAIPGVTLSLASAQPGTEVQVSVGPDQAGAVQAIQNFVSAYNSLITSINAQFQFNSTTNSSGPLATDSSVSTLQSIMLSSITYSISGNNGLVNLASLGVSMANDGTLTVDSSKLSNAISSDFSDFKNFFQASTTGFAQKLGATLDSLTSPTDGILNVDLAQNLSLQKSLTSQINDFEDRLAIQQQTLIAQYSQVDTILREYPLQMQQIQSQLANLPTTG